ncbi:MAG: HD domain-containing protein [Candidatus Riflebacteria bacterium]|nr:HD domain-containing protein [Candidatus Riflebacteria bacterium]
MLVFLNILLALALAGLTYKYFELKESIEQENKPGPDYVRAISIIIDENESYQVSHAQRVVNEAEKIAEGMNLDENQINSLRIAAYLHDSGELLPEYGFLKKKGSLSEKEWNLLKFHPAVAEKTLRMTLPDDNEVPSIIRWHHEWWDGSGYPDNLSGNQIPLLARILTVADAVSAMESERPYRPAMAKAQIEIELDKMAGIMFDPEVLLARKRVSGRN